HEIKTPLGETLTINLKNGVRNGQIIRLKNAGMYKKSGERGDLFVSISVKKVIFSLKAAFGM
ncbi:MAG: DnaJ C-terminal domain-containing protein, partial [bacterium]